MEYNVRLTKFAQEALDDIYQYVEKKTRSVQAAQSTMKLIRTELLRLKTSAKIGIDFDKKIGFQMIPDRTTYMIVAKQYLIFYVIIESNVFVLNVVNGKTNYLNKLESAIKYAQKGFVDNCG